MALIRCHNPRGHTSSLSLSLSLLLSCRHTFFSSFLISWGSVVHKVFPFRFFFFLSFSVSRSVVSLTRSVSFFLLTFTNHQCLLLLPPFNLGINRQTRSVHPDCRRWKTLRNSRPTHTRNLCPSWTPIRALGAVAATGPQIVSGTHPGN